METPKLLLIATLLSIAPVAAHADAMTIINNNVGVGTEVPEGPLHVLREGGIVPSILLESQGGQTPSKWEIKSNPNTGRLTFRDLNGSTTPMKFSATAVGNLLRIGIPSDDTVSIAGNMTISGDLTINGDCVEDDGPCADYVFEDDYPLITLNELQQFIESNNHLPNVPSAAEMQENGVTLNHLTGRLLEKIEELTLYTLQQQETIQELQHMVKEQHTRIDRLETSQ